MASQENHPHVGFIGKSLPFCLLPHPVQSSSAMPPPSTESHNQVLTKSTGSERDVKSTPRDTSTEGSPQVRFASTNEEIEPTSIERLDSIPSLNKRSDTDEARLKELSQSLQSAHLQGRRMSQFAFEPVSLPASRVCVHFLIYSVLAGMRGISYPNTGEIAGDTT